MERVAEFDPHIVLLDLTMAGMGGLEALREIKTIAPRTCVIMVTALDDLDTARGALAQGAADYLTKPFPFRYLDAVLAVHLPRDAERRARSARFSARATRAPRLRPERTQSAMPTPR